MHTAAAQQQSSRSRSSQEPESDRKINTKESDAAKQHTGANTPQTDRLHISFIMPTTATTGGVGGVAAEHNQSCFQTQCHTT
jgi:hypothetical protein